LNDQHQGGAVWSVPKQTLISLVQALLHDGRLKIRKCLSDAAALQSEMLDFRAEVSATGHWSYNAKSGSHDDMILALSLALWRLNGTGLPAITQHFMRMNAAEGHYIPGEPGSRPAKVEVELVTVKGVPCTYLLGGVTGKGAYSDREGYAELDPRDAGLLLGGQNPAWSLQPRVPWE
jgi:hypothetical protein